MRVAALSLLSVATRQCLIGDGCSVDRSCSRNSSRRIALEVFGTIAASQLAFVAVSLTHYRVRSTRLIPHVQAAIGKELRTELEVQRSVPPKLAVLVARLGHA